MENEKTRVHEICLLAPTGDMYDLAESIINKCRLDVGIYRTGISQAVEDARTLTERGAKIFISRRGVYRVLEKKYKNCVVSVETTLSDYMEMIRDIIPIKGKVAFFSHDYVWRDLETLCSLLDIETLFYTFADSKECAETVARAVREGAAYGIGGADSARYAKELGLPHKVVESSEQAIRNAVNQARQLLEVTKKEQKKQMELRVRLARYEMVMNYSHDGILAVDERGNVDVLNSGSERLLGIPAEKMLGKRVERMIPGINFCRVLDTGQKELDQIVRMGSRVMTTNLVPIMIDKKIKGVVATFQDIRALQESEKKIRLKLHEKGLRARYTFKDIQGSSRSIQRNISMAEKYARSDSTVLIHGETGTGKELFAQGIHNASSRAQGPFVAINCGSLPQNLLEAELFGYVDGAYTGARKGGKMGLFEAAHGGTIFLDEIGEMPIETQVHLLRVLQEKEIRRIGADSVVPVDIRVVAATNRDLNRMIREGSFRQDLYYRINILNLEIAPLRERKEDIREIGLHIFDTYLSGYEESPHLVGLLMEQFKDYDWPGNVRELHNIIERISVLLIQGETPEYVMEYVQNMLLAQDIQVTMTQRREGTPETSAEGLLCADRIANLEREHITRVLKECGMEVGVAAKRLGISRTTLWRRIKKYHIHN